MTVHATRAAGHPAALFFTHNRETPIMGSTLLDPVTGFWVGPHPPAPRATLLDWCLALPHPSEAALHEAAHAAAACHLNLPFTRVTIGADGSGALHGATTDDDDPAGDTPDRLIADATVSAAGPLAEYLFRRLDDLSDPAACASAKDLRLITLCEQLFRERYPDRTWPSAWDEAAGLHLTPGYETAVFAIAGWLERNRELAHWQVERLMHQVNARSAVGQLLGR